MLVPRPKTNPNKENEPANPAIEKQQKGETPTPEPRENQMQNQNMITEGPFVHDINQLQAAKTAQTA